MEQRQPSAAKAMVRMAALRRYWLAILFTAATCAVPAAFYPRLPAVIPVHWDLHGAVDGRMPREGGALLGPLVALVLLAVLIPCERLAARKPGSGDLQRRYPWVVAAIEALLLAMTCAVMLAGTGARVSIPAVASVALGVLLVVLASTLRAPASGSRGTVGAWLLGLAGVAAIIGGLTGGGLIVALLAVIVVAVLSGLHSFIAGRRGKP